MEPKDLKNSEELKSPKKEDLKKTDKASKEQKEKVPIDTIPESTPVIKETSEEKEKPEKKQAKKEKAAVEEKVPIDTVPESAPIIKETSKEEEKPEKKETKKEKAAVEEKVPVDTVPESAPVIKETPEEEEKPEKEETKKEKALVEEKVPVDTVPKSVPVIQETPEEEEKPEKEETKKEKVAVEEKVPIDTVPESAPVIQEISKEEERPEKEETKKEKAAIEEKVPIDTVPESAPVIKETPEEEEKPEKKETKKEKVAVEEKVPIDTVPESAPVIKETPEEEENPETQKTSGKEVVVGKKPDVEPGGKTEKTKNKEKKSAENSANKEKKTVEKVEKIDYSNYSQIELVNALRDVLEENDDRDIKHDVDAIKAAFYKNIKDNTENAKKAFLVEGGEEEDFVAEADPYENDIKDLLKRYRQIRIEYNKRLELEKEENLKKKYEVIEKIKGLINNEESINKTFNEFRSLQQEWREIGLVPQSKMKMLWDTYHFNVENFYDYIKINRELRDLDLKKNMEAKIKLCEKAEELLLDPSIIRAFNTLQKFHEQWREIGPVPREHKDTLWERFKAATTKINQKHQQFFEDRKLEQKKNLEAKTALCEKVESINEKEIDSHKEWDKYSKEIIDLQKIWRTIGFAPRKDNNKIYERFRTACDTFFDAKRAFYAKNKEEQQNNLQLKIDLCVQAEALKDSTDWKKTTQDFITIQKQWKEIGPVPRKQSDSIWKRFRSACDYFFDKKSEHFNEVDTEQVDNLKLKEDLIEEIKNFKSSKDVEANLKKLKAFQRRWTEIGHVPFKQKDEIQVRFREAINKLYDDLNIDEEQRNLLKFRTKMSSFSESSRGQNKMRLERDKYMNKMKQLENDLVLLDNNIGFFAESKNAESLIKDVQKKIEMTKQKIEFLKEKIRVIDEIEDSE